MNVINSPTSASNQVKKVPIFSKNVGVVITSPFHINKCSLYLLIYLSSILLPFTTMLLIICEHLPLKSGAEYPSSAPDFNGKCSQIIKSMVVNGRRIELK